MTLWCWLNVQGWGRPRSCSVSSLARAALCELLVWWVTRVTKYTSLFPHVQSFTRYWACLVMEIYSCHSQHATWLVSVNILGWLDYKQCRLPPTSPALTMGEGILGGPDTGLLIVMLVERSSLHIVHWFADTGFTIIVSELFASYNSY